MKQSEANGSFPNNEPNLWLGIDVGTSGVRAAFVTEALSLEHECAVPFAKRDMQSMSREQSPSEWLNALNTLFSQCKPWMARVNRIIVDGTSSTVLLCDNQATPLSSALMYDDGRATVEAERILACAPPSTAAHGRSSTLAKVMWLQAHQDVWQTSAVRVPLDKVVICHQVDFINAYLTGLTGTTDINNALKLGYDVVSGQWPDWVSNLVEFRLPCVYEPGDLLGPLRADLVKKINARPDCQVYFGTTDSIAAFFASGANRPGDAVTSLGSTLVLKMLVESPVFDPEQGIYSHRVGKCWLAGGASNTGGASLLHFFSLTRLKEILQTLAREKSDRPDQWQTRLNTIDAIYPLVGQGERFPVADPNMSVDFSQRPKKDEDFLIALTKGLVEVERKGLERLLALSNAQINHVYAVGGGVQNWLWRELRLAGLPGQHTLARQSQAAYGVTCLLSSQ